MATLRQIFTKMANDVKKYPNIVQLTKTLDEGFKEVAENISGGGGGGDSVSVNGIQTQGTKIGTVTVNDVPTDLYAPSYRMSLVNKTLSFSYNEGNEVHVDGFNLPTGSDVSFNSANSAGDSVGTLTIDNVAYQMYAPHVYSTTERVIGKWIDDKDLYERVVYIDQLPDGSINDWVLYDVGLTNIDTLIKLSGTVSFSNGNQACLPYVLSNLVTSQIGLIIEASGKLGIMCGSDRSSSSAYVIIQYTKVSI